jgi:tRNA-dihydrouridine synthase C
MAENAARIASLGAIGIDLNFGCPAKTVNRHDGGAALLKNPSRIFDVVSAVRRSTPIELPVGAKVRLGFDTKAQHLDIAQAAESGGASWIVVHARTRDEGYRPPAHWEYIARMREAVRIPVIANGEVWSRDDYDRIRSVSGSRHVMIGRGLLSTPDLARQVRLNEARMEWIALTPWIREFAQICMTFRSEKYAVARLKQWFKSLARSYSEAAYTFESVKRLDILDDLLSGIDAEATR